MVDQPARLAVDLQIAERVTGIMPGGAAGEACADVFHLQDVDEERREFMRPFGDAAGAFGPLRCVLEQLVEVMNHGAARAGRADDRISGAFFKDADELFGDLSRFVSVTGVERRLTAAGLAGVEFDFTSGSPQDFYSAGADRWPELVDETRYEKGYAHGGIGYHRFVGRLQSGHVWLTPNSRLSDGSASYDSLYRLGCNTFTTVDLAIHKRTS